MKAAIYIRVSTEEQKLKGYSLPEQTETCTRKAYELGATGEVEVFPDEGESGAFIDRPSLQRLFAAVRTGDIQLVIMLDPDRLARELGVQLAIAEEIEKYAKLDFVTYSRGDPNNPEDTMYFQIKGVFSQYERAKINQRMSFGRRGKAAMGKIVVPGGWTNHPGPFGYTYSNQNNDPKLEINTAEAEVIRYIFKMAYEEHLGITRITERLNQEGIPGPKGGVWHPGPLRRMLKNEVYAGTFYNFKWKSISTSKRTKSGKRQHLHRERPVSERSPVNVPAIIDRKVWETVQVSLNLNSIRSKNNYPALLQGRIKCSNCDSLYSAQCSGKNIYYRCSGRSKMCHMPMFRVSVLDNKVWEEIERLLSDPELIKQYIGQPDSSIVAELNNKVDMLQNKTNVLSRQKEELFSLHREGYITADDLKKQLIKTEQKNQKMRLEMSEVNSRIETLQKPFDFNVDEFCEYFAQRINRSSFQERLEIVRDLDLLLVIHPDKVLEIDWPFAITTIRLEPKWVDNHGFSMTLEIKEALKRALDGQTTASEIVRQAILEAPLNSIYRKAQRGNRTYSNVCLSEEVYNKLKQLQGTYKVSAMSIIEWALQRHLKGLGYL